MVDHYKVAFIVCLCFIFFSCRMVIKSNNSYGVFETPHFKINNTKLLSVNDANPEGGLMYLKHKSGVNFSLEKSNSLDEIPQPLKSRFEKSFTTYHYHKFFDKIDLDKKVAKLFKDSVEIVLVKPKNVVMDGKPLFKCDPCNVKAQLQFKGMTFIYPAVVSKKWISEATDFTFTSYNIKGVKLINYISTKKGAPSGLYFLNGDDTFTNIIFTDYDSDVDIQPIVNDIQFFTSITR